MSKKEAGAGKKKKSALREWVDSILFAVVAAAIIRWLFFEAFTIPTPSMENSLLVGDFLFVSKLHYGTRTPQTPLQVPLTHQYIWGTKIPSYLDWIQLPSYRLPGFSEVKRGDPVVFNLPPEHPALVNKYGVENPVLPDLKGHPIDLRVDYIKRCVAVGGDSIQVKAGQVYINGKPQENPRGMESEYFVVTTTPVNEVKVFKENGVTEPARQVSETYGDTIPSNDEQGYIVYTTKNIAESLKEKYDFVKAVRQVNVPANIPENYLYPYPHVRELKWNKDNYGPVYVPKEGATITLTPANVALYSEVILYHEGNEEAKLDNGKILVGGKELKQYTFKQNYYFMMGDNRHNSADSRYWGFVPEDHIVGKAVFVWMSIDPDPSSFWNKIRWSRVFRSIN